MKKTSQPKCKYRFLVKPSIDGQWIAQVLSAKNGQVILTSETYKSSRSAQRAINNLVQSFFNCKTYEIQVEKQKVKSVLDEIETSLSENC